MPSKTKVFKLVYPKPLKRSFFCAFFFAKSSVNVFLVKANIMLVCSYAADCYVTVPVCNLALCNEYSFIESSDEILVRG